MELPTGWFGRPRDNMHRLTWSTVRDHKVFVEFDGQVHLLLADAEVIEDTTPVLALRCSQLVVDWREFGTNRRHAEVHDKGGVVRFHASDP
ncbi:MAG: hypothetical protein R2823_03055 [Acidimicrobiia bacterium]